MLAGIGGLMGVTLAWIVAVLVRSLTPVPMAVPLIGRLRGRGAVRVGRPVLRHLSRAARRRLDPIEALRVGKMTVAALNAGIGLALATVREHKLRSFLTVLGVIIGTGAVIGVGSIIAGLDGAITGLMRSIGPGHRDRHQDRRPWGNATREERRRKPLTYEDARAIAERCPAVEHVSPYLFPPQGMHTARVQGQRRLRHSTWAAPRKATPPAARR